MLICCEKMVYSELSLVKLDTDRDFKELPKTDGQLLTKKYRSKPKEVEE